MTQAPPPPPSDPNDPLGSPGGSVPPPPPSPPVAPPPPVAPSGGYPPPAGADEPPPGYGAPPAGFGTAPPPPAGGGYGEAPMGYGAGAGAALSYADWAKRALGALIDFVVPAIVAFLIGRASTGLGLLANLAALAWGLYNAYLGGQTGQSYGKKMAGTRLISEATGAPIGGGLGIGRYFVHILDAIPCYVGFLWPLWDSKRQTFADKILKTVVVNADAPR